VFAEQRGFSFPLLSDFNREAMTAYGVMMDEYNGYHGVSRRAMFVVDKDGRVAHAEVVTERFVKPDPDAALSVVRALATKEGGPRNT
jgi:peroxiredoxin